MEYSFPRYLRAKQSVDDRALNKDVLQSLKLNLPPQPIRVIEVGAGIGTMLRRLVRWNILHNAEYILVDEMPENIEAAILWIPEWAAGEGLRVEQNADHTLILFDSERLLKAHLVLADVFDFIRIEKSPADLLIAHAFLDLLPLPASLPKLLSLTKNLAWLTLTFDGMTTLEPPIDPALDMQIEQRYHQTMDSRPSGGDSRTGRRLFGYLSELGMELLSAGASDWVVHAVDGVYPLDERYFLEFILHFFEESLSGSDLDAEAFAAWLKKRRAQIEHGELVYIAHQLDFLVKQPFNHSV
jgi:hypothetical protein